MCALTACRFVEPFINDADCQPSGPKFDVKHKDRLLQAAKRAEKMLTQSRKDRCEALSMKPVVLLEPLSREQLSSVAGDSVTDDTTTDIEPESNKTEVAPTEADVNGFLTSAARAKNAKTPKSVARKKISVKSGDVNNTGKRNATECVDEPQNAEGSKQQDDLDGISPSEMTSAAKAKNAKTPKSVARKKISVKSGDVNNTGKRNATECVDEPQNATGSKQQDDLDGISPSEMTSAAKAKNAQTPKSVARKKISVKSGDVNNTGKRNATECVDEPQNAAGSKQQDDLDGISPSKMQKMQQFDSAESQAIVGETVLDVASNSTGSAMVLQEVMSNLQPRGGIRQSRGRVSRRHYANVGNRVVPAELSVRGGFPVLRGRGRGRARGPRGSVGFTNVHRNEHYGTSGGALAYGILQSGMPNRGRGGTHVVGSHISSVCQQPHVAGASVGNSPLLKPASNTNCEYHLP